MNQAHSLEAHVRAARDAFERYQIKTVPQLKALVTALQVQAEALKQHRASVRLRRRLMQKIERLDNIVRFHESGEALQNYEKRAMPFIVAKQNESMLSNCDQNRHRATPGQRQACGLGKFTAESGLGRQGKIAREYQAVVLGKESALESNWSDKCPKCNTAMRFCAVSSEMQCTTCGLSQFAFDATMATMSYDNDVEFTSFSYKRTNHFEDWLQKHQAKESTEVSPQVLDMVMRELYMNRITRCEEITPTIVRKILKDLKLRKTYDHVAQITWRISGTPPPRLTPELEEKCRLMFLAIQEPFQKHKGPNRKNFLSYSYCLYKFFELLGCDEFLESFALLKGRDKLEKQDQIFKKICADLNWEFIPSSA